MADRWEDALRAAERSCELTKLLLTLSKASVSAC
jgi:hypothetical protein